MKKNKTLLLIITIILSQTTFSQNGQFGGIDEWYWKINRQSNNGALNFVNKRESSAPENLKVVYPEYGGMHLYLKKIDPTSVLKLTSLDDSSNSELRLGLEKDFAWIQSYGEKPLYVNRIGNNTLINVEHGNVGIGTTNPGNWKLAVNGQIRAKEIKVETGWSDFVFFDDYKLPTLQEVENHIKENGHLKDIPSAKEVEENGIFLGEMDSKLLQKIEELTLYTIAQEKKIKELESLNKKFLELQSRLEKLESGK